MIFRAARKNILQSVDHILNHELVLENPQAAAFVSELEKEVKEVKEEFTKSVHSIPGTMNGNDGERDYLVRRRRNKYPK